MIEHDGDVGKLLQALDDHNVANDTIVIYTTDNGAQYPDAAMTPFRSEKDSNWEAAFRVPAMIRWPVASILGRFPPNCSLVSTGFQRCWRRRAIPT
jgi:arylsulfatase A-like enzyme